MDFSGLDGYTGGLRDAGLGNAPMAGDLATGTDIYSLGHAGAYAKQLEEANSERLAQDLDQIKTIADARRAVGQGEQAYYQGLATRRAYEADSPYYEDERRMSHEAALRQRDKDLMLLEEANWKREDNKKRRQAREDFEASALFGAFKDLYDDGEPTQESIDAINEVFGTKISKLGFDEFGGIIAKNDKGEDVSLTPRFYGPLSRFANAIAETEGEQMGELVAQSLPKNLYGRYREEREAAISAAKLEADMEKQSRNAQEAKAKEYMDRAMQYRKEAREIRKEISEGLRPETDSQYISELEDYARELDKRGAEAGFGIQFDSSGRFNRRNLAIQSLTQGGGFGDAADSNGGAIYNPNKK